MKSKFLVFAAVFMFVLSFAGQAMAYFAEGDLIRVVYDQGGTKEVMTDLGSGLNYTTANSTDTNLTANTFSLGQLGAADWSNVNVAYFTITTAAVSGANALWLSGPTTGTQGIAANGKWNGASSATLTLLGNNKLSGNAQNINGQGDAGAYVALINSSNIGTFKGEVAAANSIETSLASFSTGSTYVDQYLYYYSTPNVKNSAYVQVVDIRTYADGHTEINPSAVPIPAAAYLLGSGLLALVGIRRKTQMGA